MLDEFGTENLDDRIAGFPSHSRRGFEPLRLGNGSVELVVA